MWAALMASIVRFGHQEMGWIVKSTLQIKFLDDLLHIAPVSLLALLVVKINLHRLLLWGTNSAVKVRC